MKVIKEALDTLFAMLGTLTDGVVGILWLTIIYLVTFGVIFAPIGIIVWLIKFLI